MGNRERILYLGIFAVFSAADGYKKWSCFIPYFKAITQRVSTVAAMAEAKRLEKSGAVSDCHLFSHVIGETSVERYNFDMGQAFSSCEFGCSDGCFHGVMERYVRYAADPATVISKIKNMCDSVGTDWVRKRQCIHGIGHGWTNAHDNPERWGKSAAIVAPALKLCEEVKDTREQLSRCLTGVFHGIAVFLIKGEYGLSINQEDPLELCFKQQERYRNECFISMHGVLRHVSQDDFLRAAKFIENIPEDRYAQPAIMHLAMATSNQTSNTAIHAQGIQVCRSLQERLAVPCIQGYAFGLFKPQGSGEEYKEPLGFCTLAGLTVEERMGCLEYIFSYLELWYSKERARNICQGVEQQYREFCHSQIRGI